MPKAVKRRSTNDSNNLKNLLARLGPVPEEWIKDLPAVKHQGVTIGLEYCDNYGTLIDAWREALRWTEDLDIALSVMLAVVVSTKRQGEQIWARIVAVPGSGKTKLCDALLTNTEYCYHLGQIKGFHSGYSDGSDDDYSLIARTDGKTMISPEGDELLKSPTMKEVLSQGRRMFDGTASASYKNRKSDRLYSGLRQTWIIAGTPSMRLLNNAALGDRCVDCIIERPDPEEERDILWRTARAASADFRNESDGRPDTLMSPEMTKAYALTGGYVGWLRKNVDRIAKGLIISEKDERRCMKLAELVAHMRARPDKDLEEEAEPQVEMATRLTSQLIRLAWGLAVVMNKDRVDDEVMSRVAKVARDTCAGLHWRIAQILYDNPDGVGSRGIANALQSTPQVIGPKLSFLRSVQVVRRATRITQAGTVSDRNYWALTSKLRTLMREVL